MCVCMCMCMCDVQLHVCVCVCVCVCVMYGYMYVRVCMCMCDVGICMRYTCMHYTHIAYVDMVGHPRSGWLAQPIQNYGRTLSSFLGITFIPRHVPNKQLKLTYVS